MDWLFVRVNLKKKKKKKKEKKRPYYLIFSVVKKKKFKADLGEWSLGFMEKHCLVDVCISGLFLFLFPNCLTDVAFFCICQ